MLNNLLQTPFIQRALASYGRSFLAGGLALVLAGVDDPKSFGLALLAAVVPVALRAINPKDPAFGNMPSQDEMQKSIDDAVALAILNYEKEKAAAAAAAKKANPRRVTKKTTE